jgi:hypothetical protein
MSNDPSNAERQARHRAKQREYVQGLEAENARLRALLGETQGQRVPVSVTTDVPATTTVADDDVVDDDNWVEAYDELVEWYEKLKVDYDALLVGYNEAVARHNEQVAIVKMLLERTKHYRDLINTHLRAILRDMYPKKLPTFREFMLKLNPWLTDAELDRMDKPTVT